MRILRLELKRAFGSREMKISLLLGMLLVIGQVIGFYTMHLENGALDQQWRLEDGAYEVGVLRDTLYQSFIGGEGFTFFNELYFSLLPILAAFPFAGSFFKDRESGYMKNLCCRMDRTRYHLAKYIAVFLSGGVAAGFPYLAGFAVSALIYPADFPNFLAMRGGTNELSLFADYYFIHPLAYVMLYLLVIVAFAGVLATFSLLVSFWAKNILVVWFVPYMVYTTQRLLFEKLDIYQWAMEYMMNSQSKHNLLVDMTVGRLAVAFLIMAAITFGGFLVLGRKREVIV